MIEITHPKPPSDGTEVIYCSPGLCFFQQGFPINSNHLCRRFCSLCQLSLLNLLFAIQCREDIHQGDNSPTAGVISGGAAGGSGLVRCFVGFHTSSTRGFRFGIRMGSPCEVYWPVDSRPLPGVNSDISCVR
jgi:hypothetical protein